MLDNLICAWDLNLTLISLGYGWDLPEIRLSFYHICLNFSRGLPKIRLRIALDSLEIRVRFARNLPGICLRFNRKGLLHLVTFGTKLLYVVLFHKDITQPKPKTSGPWYRCDLSPHRVSSPIVQYFWRFSSLSGDQSSVCIVWKACTALFIQFQELHELV